MRRCAVGLLPLVLLGCSELWPLGRQGADGAAQDRSSRDLLVDGRRDGPRREAGAADQGPVDAALPFDLLPAGVIIKTYGKQTLQPGSSPSHFPDLWDLTICQAARQAIGCDLRLRYRVDLSGVTVPGPGQYLWTEVGIHEEGEPDFNPSGHGGWMVSYLVNPGSDPAKFDLTDKHSAQSAGGLGEASYDVHDCTSPVVTTPVGTSNSFGFWYDRDGADAAHTSHPLAGDGKTYNTKGVYKIELCYRATGLTSGTLCHRVNGVQPGFFTATGTKMPDIYPAGLSVGGEMDDMVVFVGFGNGGGQGTVVVDSVEVVGCPRP